MQRNDVAAILALQAPSFTSVNPNGAVFDYAAMEARTRLMASLIDSVIYVHNTIRDFATRWFVDGVRVDGIRPYRPGAPPYAPNPDPPTGCGRF